MLKEEHLKASAVTILPNTYFESHIQVLVAEGKDIGDELVNFLQGKLKGILKKSKNYFKKAENGYYIKMLN